jgi:hypothetical protein
MSSKRRPGPRQLAVMRAYDEANPDLPEARFIVQIEVWHATRREKDRVKSALQRARQLQKL